MDRPFFGALAVLVGCLAMRSGILQVPNDGYRVFDRENMRGEVYTLVCFVVDALLFVGIHVLDFPAIFGNLFGGYIVGLKDTSGLPLSIAPLKIRFVKARYKDC